MSNSDDGKQFIQSNCLDILQETNLIIIEGDTASLSDCKILEKWKTRQNEPFQAYFKAQLLSKITISKKPHIGYFSDVLRLLLDYNSFEPSILEISIKEARKNRGISSSGAEELGGKIDFCTQFMYYFNMIQKIGTEFVVYAPRKLLQTIFSLALEDFNKSSVRLYSELFEHIDTEYFPLLNKRESRLLKRVLNTVDSPTFIEGFNFANVPDGGRIVQLNNKDYNAVMLR